MLKYFGIEVNIIYVSFQLLVSMAGYGKIYETTLSLVIRMDIVGLQYSVSFFQQLLAFWLELI